MTTTRKDLFARLDAATARTCGRTPEERSRMAAIGRELAKETRHRIADGAGARGCDANGVPKGLPIRSNGLPKLSTFLSPELCERLKRTTLGGVRVFSEENF